MTADGYGAVRIGTVIGCSASMVRRLRAYYEIPIPVVLPPGRDGGHAPSPYVVRNPKIVKRLNAHLEVFARSTFLPRQPGTGVAFANLKPEHCRFPLGTVGEVSRFFCGKPVAGCSFCLDHRQLCYAVWRRA